MKQETNKTAGPEAGGTSGQSVHRSKFRQKSQQEQTAASKFRMEERGEKLERAKDKLAKQKPPKKPGPVRRIGRAAGGAAHGFVHKAIAMLNYQGVSGLYFHCSSFDFNIRLYNITLCVQSTNYGTGHDL